TNGITTCTLIAESSGSEWRRALEPASDGTYRIAIGNDIPPGAYIVEAFSGSTLVGTARITVEP
ncbi:MAG TPA: hypothetical protein VGM92_08385, partial [Candidatus Kapabacteria bacterium]